MFRITMLPARHGDCLWIEYGDPDTPRHMLIDGGPLWCYAPLEARIDALPAGGRDIELTVITHVDADHIVGIIRLIAEKNIDVSFNDVWFNGWRHLAPPTCILGGMQGEFLSALLHYKLDEDQWNAADPFFGGTIEVPDEGPLPVANLAGGLRLTLLSPTRAMLDKLRERWDKDVTAKNFTPGDVEEGMRRLLKEKRLVPKGVLGGGREDVDVEPMVDVSAHNGSSIAFLAEFEGTSCLFLGDAFPRVVASSIRRLTGPGKRLKVDAVKVSHHGSAGNTTKGLLKTVDCKRFLISTNGAYHKHPDKPALDKIITCAGPGVELYFNYLSKTTKPWADRRDQAARNYRAIFPDSEEAGMVVEL